MPFYVYQCERDPVSGSVGYSRRKKIPLAGKKGPFYLHNQERFEDVKEDERMRRALEWSMKEAEMLRLLECDSEECAIVIDLKPKVDNNVSLYQLRDVWGYSYKAWTPILLHLETLFVDREANNPAQFKKRFSDEQCEREHIYEFLYLNGGYGSSSWSWGRIGSVNGALLLPDALKYFLSILNAR